MAGEHSTHLSGCDNPHVTILNPQFLLNADGQIVKRTRAKGTTLAIVRFFAKIQISETRFFEDTPCWEWIGCKGKGGYGQFKSDGRRGAVKSSPHRFSYDYFIAPIPDGYEVDHRCRNRGCANPLHLEMVTVKENRIRRGEAVTHCKNGHEFTDENTYVTPAGSRQCRICLRERQKKFHQKHPSAQRRYRHNAT